MPQTFPARTLRSDGYDFHYVEAGAGAPLLLVHGSLCDYRFWAPQMQPLGVRRRVIALSLRHYWPEAWNGAGGGFSVEQHAADLAAFVRGLNLGPVDLVGHSRGGSVAYALAQRAPELLRSLVLAEPGLRVCEAGGAEDLDRGGFRGRALELLRQGRADDALQLFIDTVSGSGTWARTVPAIQRMMRDNANTLIGQVAESYPRVTPDNVLRLRQPLLLVGGARSPQPYPAVLDALQGLMPGARRATIPAASHAMNLWNAPAFNQALESFLAGTS
jgi:pimeloyl-ACP methyl ester carboxylesterase